MMIFKKVSEHTLENCGEIFPNTVINQLDGYLNAYVALMLHGVSAKFYPSIGFILARWMV